MIRPTSNLPANRVAVVPAFHAQARIFAGDILTSRDAALAGESRFDPVLFGSRSDQPLLTVLIDQIFNPQNDFL